MGCCGRLGHNFEHKHNVQPFICGGCWQQGLHSKYECSKCKLDLHGKCAQALGEPSITTDFFGGCEFLFLDLPPARGRYCDVCGLDIRGYHYSCSKMGLDMHPCCEGLPSTIVSGCNVLHLRDKMTSKCNKCGKQRLRSSRKRNTWCYASSCGDYHLHVACLNDMLLSEEEMKGDDSVLARIDPLPPIVPHLLQGDDSAMKGDDTALARIDPRPPIVPERRKKGIVWWVFKLAPSIISAVKGDRRPLYGIGSSILKKWSLNQSAPLAELH